MGKNPLGKCHRSRKLAFPAHLAPNDLSFFIPEICFPEKYKNGPFIAFMDESPKELREGYFVAFAPFKMVTRGPDLGNFMAEITFLVSDLAKVPWSKYSIDPVALATRPNENFM